MVLLTTCLTHQQPRGRIFTINGQCQVACQDCLAYHQNNTDCQLAICLNDCTLNYFTQFTQYIHQIMAKWMERVRNDTFQAVFCIQSKEGSLWQNPSIFGQISNIALSVLQQHKNLMLANKSFVFCNKDNEMLYHPQCIKDIYNLLVHPWQVNAQIILFKFNHLLQQTFPEQYQQSMPNISIRQQLFIQIQNHRNQLIDPWRNQLIIDMRPQPIINKRDSSGQIDTNGSESNQVSSPHHSGEISQFHVSQQTLHIKVIDSYEQIEPQQHCQPSPSHLMQQQNSYLLNENKMLKIQNLNLKEDNSILKDKCEKMQAQRRQMASSSKKRRETQLNSQLLSEIVQLQCELNDKRHDLQILIAYLNDLSTRRVITPQQLHQKLLPLRTITLR